MLLGILTLIVEPNFLVDSDFGMYLLEHVSVDSITDVGGGNGMVVSAPCSVVAGVAVVAFASSVILTPGEDGSGDDFLPNPHRHRPEIIDVVAAIPATRRENDNTGCINGSSPEGMLLPIVEAPKTKHEN
ncbi:hypothetical protein SLA2020_476320 [Shorea laevis]